MEYLKCPVCGSWELVIRFKGVPWAYCLSCGQRLEYVVDWRYDADNEDEYAFEALYVWS